MNTNFETAKQHFIEKGYCEFSIKDLDINFYNFLENNLLCDESSNIQHKFYKFRFDSQDLETKYKSETESYIDAREKLEELLNNTDNEKISQSWYYSHDFDEGHRDIIKKGIYNICKYFYDLSDNQKLNNDELQLTYYDKGCRFTPHHDGVSINLCSMIIYLNKNYNKDNGGLLLLNDEEIVPEFGNVALMDLSKFNISHGVTEVTNGIGRFAILDFPKLKTI